MRLLSLKEVTRTVVLPNQSELAILKGIDLEVNAGEQVAIVGQSGTGKSTLLNIIGMLDLPDSGQYHFNGLDVAQLSEARRAALRGDSFGFIFQQFNLIMNRTAISNVEVPLLYASDSRLLKRKHLAAEMLERVGLGDRLYSNPGEFSGGEQQRVAIARALVRRPKVILADEPTGALDLRTGKLVMDLLEEVAAEQNAALITITHDMSVAARAQTVYEIIDGRLQKVTADSALNQKSLSVHSAQLDDQQTLEVEDV
ncbi:ABC transporter ATP-binding protein [Gleimia sp. 6138-11-ORH1]|uniref:ABC transporter ATP-binding protein n=1 Tax=Gleimia sp. 6138-11-ORH1 TaxID=2973937 RepID=UPI002167F453|nr:ABC transporter ATP-binding protein [Gleimia sp. 6138-11-ORH1]MCS4485052.1 ABC transporter ATP-binding protein [Gleimia sp. 6138-11-ORH1]